MLCTFNYGRPSLIKVLNCVTLCWGYWGILDTIHHAVGSKLQSISLPNTSVKTICGWVSRSLKLVSTGEYYTTFVNCNINNKATRACSKGRETLGHVMTGKGTPLKTSVSPPKKSSLCHKCPTHLSHKYPIHLSHKYPIPISQYVLTSHFTCVCMCGNFHITNIDVPAGIVAIGSSCCLNHVMIMSSLM